MKFKKILLTLLLVICTLGLLGCDFTTYTVTFDSNGGSAVAQKTTTGYVARPTQPTKQGSTFEGWYTDASLTKEFDFSSKITDNITLYAKWSDSTNPTTDPGTNPGTDPGKDPGTDNSPAKKYNVTFEVNGGSPITYASETTGLITKPADPVKEGYTFAGWCTDSACKNLFDFSKPVTKDTTLYAKWIKEEEGNTESGTISTEVIDPYILEKTITNFDCASSSDYALFLDYAIFNRMATLEVNLSKAFANSDEFSEFVNTAMDELKIEVDAKFNFSTVSTKFTTTITYAPTATTSASLVDAYTQMDTVCTNRASKRLDTFNNFKIDSVTNTYTVTDSEQLCYVLERGYRPVFISDSCSAKRMYDAARSILIEIVDDDMSDVEKLHAIYDWLILNVTYDGTLFSMVTSSSSDLKKYKGFYLEGVFDDKRAVCDGISKAFMVMARIEGIECVQVSGVSLSSGINHAWNKVRLNGRWYVVDATGGGVIVNNTTEMLSHRTLLCNEQYYATLYQASIYTNLVADSNFNIYKEMKYSFNEVTHDCYIESIDELADILEYYYGTNDFTKTIDFFWAGESALTSSDYSTALVKANVRGIGYSHVEHDGTVIFRFN